MGDTAKVSFDGKSVELPILKGTDGPAVVDIRKLYAEADVFTYDPGFTSTARLNGRFRRSKRRFAASPRPKAWVWASSARPYVASSLEGLRPLIWPEPL